MDNDAPKQDAQQPTIQGPTPSVDATTSAPSTNDAPQQDASISNNDVKAVMGKMSAMEKERNDLLEKYNSALKKQQELEQQHQRQSQITSNLENVYRQNPDAYEALRQSVLKTQGRDIGSYEQVYGSAQQATYQQPQQNFYNQPQQNDGFTQNNDDGFQRAQLSRAIDQLTNQHPELDPSTAGSKEEYEQRMGVLSELRLYADAIQTNRKIPLAEAMQKAYLLFNGGDAIADAEKVGELKGRAASLANGVGTDGAGSTGKASGESTNVLNMVGKLDPDRRAQYDRIVKRNGEKFGLRFLNKLQSEGVI